MRKARAFSRLLVLCSANMLSFGISTANAQSVANYAVTRTTGVAYSSILAVGLPPGSWRNSGSFINDDNRSFPVDIGFDFWYDGVRYTQVSISTNGYVDFSSSIADGGPTGGPYGYANTRFTSNSGTFLALAPIYDDMTTQGAVNPLGNSIRTLLSGVAPNRILTIEWYNMAVYQNTTPSLNFQVKLHETTGQIEYLYGTMNAGTATFSYTCGINAASISASPTAAELKCQQTANSTTFNNGVQNNLSVMPTTNSQLVFTPPVPTPPSGALTFSGVQMSQMTLNFPNWATNEVGYVIYVSTDNINFDFIAQTAANATSATITGLYSGTTYYWRVYAVTEGCLSTTFLSGTQATLPGTTFISVVTGNWGTGTTWNTGTVPGPNDNVIIANGHTVTVNANASCHNILINQGGAASVLQVGNNATSRTLTINGNVTIGINGKFMATIASNTAHMINLYGNITNNGIVDFSSDPNSFCNVSFLHPYATQLVNGTGVTNRYNLITVNKGTDITRIVEIQTSTFVAAAGFLTLTNGTLKISTTGAVTITPFNITSSIPSSCRLWLNSSSLTVNTTGGNINLFGQLQVTSGTMNIGNAANNCLMSNGGLFTMDGGTVTIAGRFDRLNTATLTRFTITNGTLILNSVGSTSTTNAPFMMDINGSQFYQSGGTIIIRRSGTGNLGFLCTGGNINSVTGGTLQIGDALSPTAQIIQVNTVSPVGGFRIASANVTGFLITNPLTVQTNVEILSGTFFANNLNVNVARNWSNTGGTYTAGTNTTTFNGTLSQSISRTASAENFNHLVFSNAGIKTLASNINCRNLTINSGATLDVGTPGFLISTIGNWSNAGTFVEGDAGTVLCNGIVAQTIGGAALTTFRNLTIQNAAGVSLTSNENILGALTLTTGMFTTTGFDFTLISNSLGTARIAQITVGNITGNVIMQRYIYNGPTQWRQMCAPVNATTLQDWNDDLITTGFPGSDYPSMTFYSIATYDETALGPKEYGYTPPTNVTNPITPKKGYYVYVGPVPVPVAVKGPPVKMNQSFTLTRTVSAGATEDGWNMLGNPYPSTIDWDAVAFTRTGTDNVLSVWNPTIAQYATYVGGVGVNGGTRYIASSQAFWVHAIAASPTMSLTEAVKSSEDASFLHAAQQQQINNLLSLTISGAPGRDQAIIRFDPLATDTFDINFDALKMASPDTTVPYLASVTTNLLELCISTLPSVNTDITVPLHVTVGVSGNYSIRRDSISDLPNSMCVILEDLMNGTITQLSQGSSYACFISDTTSAVRFLLHFGPSLTIGNVASSCGNSSDGKAFARGTGSGPWDYTWKDSTGSTITVTNSVIGTDTLFGCAPGQYIVEVNGNDGYCAFRSDTVTVNGPSPIQTGATILPSTCVYTMDGAIHINVVTGGNSPYLLTWPDGSNADSLVNLPAGNYPLIITDANGCIDTTLFLVSASSSLSTSFTATPDTVVLQSLISFSNYSTGANTYEWDFGDSSPINSSANPIYSYSIPGTMTVTLVASDGLCYDTTSETVFIIDNTSINENGLMGDVGVIGAHQEIDVLFNLPSVEHAVVRVYDAAGKLITEKEQTIGKGRMEIPMMNVSSEMYSVIVVLPEKTYAAKVVLIK